jgi:hypothetical protein
MRDVPPAVFSSRRAIAPMMWTLLAIASCELVVVHLLLALWSPAAALAVSLATLAGIGWLIRGIASLSRLPSMLVDDRLTLRAGRIKGVVLPLSQIAGVRGEPDRGEARAPDVLNLALVAHPNVVLDLASPLVRRGRAYRAVAHRLDDAPGFVAALDAARPPRRS